MTNRRMYDLNYQVEEILSRDEQSADHTDADIPPKYLTKTLDEYEEEEVEWLIDGFIPKGQITILCGDGGSGKTSFWTSIVASISNGEPTLFDGSIDRSAIPKRETKKCMFFSSEDAVEYVVKKKLKAAHANMSNILTVSLTDDDFEKIKLGSDDLEGRIKYYKPALCIIDPLQGFVPEKLDMSKRNAVRQTMRCLIEWGQKYGTTFLIVMHTNKQQNVWGRTRMSDSADLWDIARSVLIFGNCTHDPNGQKYISHEKCNYAPTGKTMILSNTDGIPTFDRWSDEKDRDFVLKKAKAKKEKEENIEVNE